MPSLSIAACSSRPVRRCRPGAGPRMVVLACAGLCLWNVTVAFVVGIVLHRSQQRRDL